MLGRYLPPQVKPFALALIACCASASLFADPAPDATTALTQSDCETALRMWREWAQHGDAGAQHVLAALLYKGKGVARDEAEAAQWMRKAADQGLASAQYDLSVMYMTGRGITKDDSETARWTGKAAEQGFAPAQHNLGSQYLNGTRGVTKDAPEGIRWFKKAAEQGWVPSQRSLVAVYLNGKDAQKELVEAYKWATIAMAGTQAGPERLQTGRVRDEIAKSMTPSQVEQASQLARDWKQTGIAIYPDPRFARLEPSAKVAGGQTIEARAYTVPAPTGDGWHAQVDSYNDTVAFTRSSPAAKEVTRISVARSELDLPTTAVDETSVLTAFQCVSEATFREEGKAKSRKLGEVTKRVETIGGKTLYVMRYLVTDQSLSVSVESSEATYFYLPANWRESKRVYLFGIAQAQTIGNAVLTEDISELNSMISGFREK